MAVIRCRVLQGEEGDEQYSGVATRNDVTIGRSADVDCDIGSTSARNLVEGVDSYQPTYPVMVARSALQAIDPPFHPQLRFFYYTK